MGTLIEDEAPWEDHYNVSEYGLVWVVFNKILHLNVLICTLLGLARLDVKFRWSVDLVRRISYVMIAQSWYMTLKLALIATLIYLFNESLDAESRVSLMKLNCSKLNQLNFFGSSESIEAQTNTTTKFTQRGFFLSRLTRAYQAIAKGDHWTTSGVVHATLREDSGWKSSTTLLLANALDSIGGPFRLLGNRATLMYGYFSMAIYCLLAMFPTVILTRNISFNFIRFMLNDAACLRDLHYKRCRFQKWLSNGSRRVSLSLLSWCIKKTVNQRNLRCFHIHTGQERLLRDLRSGEIIDNPTEPGGVNGSRRNSLARSSIVSEHKMFAPLKLPRHSPPTSHHHSPSYNVTVANKNLAKFVPFVRGEHWFKIVTILYPTVVLLLASFILVLLGFLSFFLTNELHRLCDTCAKELQRKIDLASNWTYLDMFTFVEMHFTVLTLTIAGSFYIPYYFGTLLELTIWVQELLQQLNLCVLVLELTHFDNRRLDSSSTLKSATKYGAEQQAKLSDRLVQNPSVDTQRDNGYDTLGDECVNQFGGFKTVLALVSFYFSTQSQKLKRREMAAVNLISNKQTLLRATYVNLNLYFDDLKATRQTVKIIMIAAVHIVFGFALLIGVTKSQYGANYALLLILMALSFFVLNSELVFAANLNTEMNKLLPQIHSLICSLTAVGSDPDLLEFWQRHILGCGTDHDAMSYQIYHRKITWESIGSFDGAIVSAFLFNMY